MRILVTGSSGHLGEALVRVLRSAGEEVVVVDVNVIMGDLALAVGAKGYHDTSFGVYTTR